MKVLVEKKSIKNKKEVKELTFAELRIENTQGLDVTGDILFKYGKLSYTLVPVLSERDYELFRNLVKIIEENIAFLAELSDVERKDAEDTVANMELPFDKAIRAMNNLLWRGK